MPEKLDSHSLDQLFNTARTRNVWTEKSVSEAEIRELYELLKLGPTAANCSPARFVWLRTAEGKARRAALASPGNRPKILSAPVTVIIGHDLDFADRMPQLFPARGAQLRDAYREPALAQTMAFRNGTLQGGYL